MNRKQSAALAIATLATLGMGAAPAQAQGTWPNKPIRWIIPYAAGGGTDVIARPIATKLSEVLGQPILYENRAGGGGLIAGETVAKSPADGYTLLVGSGNTHTFPTLLYEKVPYDPVKDYQTITNFVDVPNVLVAIPKFPPNSIKEIVAFGKANPGKINWASSGNGAGGHLALVLFAQQAGIKVTHVPYKGAGPAVTALLGGESDMLFANTGVFLAHIKAGKMKPLGVSHMTRLPLFPDVPTLNESGFPNFISATYYGLLAPAGTPRPIIDRLHGELVKVIRAPESLQRLASVGAIAVADTPEQFAEMLRQDVAKWSKIIKDHNIKPD
jgi:tripartite-type tricarboxylate transporter receptor subunit TctC